MFNNRDVVTWLTVPRFVTNVILEPRVLLDDCCWLFMVVMIYVVESLHAIDDNLDGVCMYWNLLIIVDDLLLNICNSWVICSCIHDVGVRLYIHIGNDWILYPYWRRRILSIHIGDDYDTDVSKLTTLRWPVPHAYSSLV
jgi:hypothetical protein